MKLLYRFGVWIAKAGLDVGGVFSPRLKRFQAGRKNLFQKLESFRQSNPGELAWFHVASLGEYEQARPVISELKKSRTDLLVAVSFFSPSGFEPISKRKPEEIDFITYLPLDGKSEANRFVEILKPELAFFVKYDLWFHHLEALRNRDTPTFLFSAAFRSDQIYFKRAGFFREMLFMFDYIFTQNNLSVELLKSINYHKASRAGDSRFDRVKAIASSPRRFEDISDWVDGKPVVVCGSVWEEDMRILIPLINSNPDFHWIIAPHDLNPEPINNWSKQISLSSVTYSTWDTKEDSEVLFIDNIGMLSSLYQFAKIGYVGGAFGSGLHNILEVVGYGIPVIFGKLKKPEKFPEAQEAIQQGCGFEVAGFGDLKGVFEELKVIEKYQKSCNSAQKWVKANLGAANKIIAEVEQITKKS